MYKLFLETHSGFRYVVMILLIAALINAFAGWFGGRNYSKNNQRLNLFTLISAHIQLLLGIILYFLSPFVALNNMGAAMKDNTLRYWTVEHIFMMIIAIVLITVGYSKSKKLLNSAAKHRTIAVFFGLAFIIIIAAIVMSGRGLLTMTH